MATDNKNAKGAAAGAGLRREAAKEEREVEREKGSHLKKGAERFDERSRSAGSGGAEKTQKPDN
jgi:hypothetical protein